MGCLSKKRIPNYPNPFFSTGFRDPPLETVWLHGGDISTGVDQDVRLLLHQKALVDANGTGVTPLYTAAKHGQTELVKLLLEAQADVDPW